ncbi:MAG TPA: hypothetical protein VEB40_03910 [Flavipsychrobacter sp.]|nr:hypothetical protein [Flavipsychrobacter sp.]
MKLQTLFTSLVLMIAIQASAQNVRKIVVNERDDISGYYLAMEPQLRAGEPIRGVLVLLSGFSQLAEHTFPETKLPNVAYANGILTVCFAGGFRAHYDNELGEAMTAMFKDIVKRYNVGADKFVLGGFSAGGGIVLRYTELCNEYPERYPIKPKAVFMVDSPIDIFTLWDMLDEAAKANFSEAAVQEANEAMRRMREQFGVPKENVVKYAALNPFSMNKAFGENEKYLKNTAVRAYHEVDIAWRLVNRRQTVRHGNYLVTAELINRLLLMGNDKAEFMQSERKGYRSNGMRHPHSWSIVDEAECISWVKTILGQ